MRTCLSSSENDCEMQPITQDSCSKGKAIILIWPGRKGHVSMQTLPYDSDKERIYASITPLINRTVILKNGVSIKKPLAPFVPMEINGQGYDYQSYDYNDKYIQSCKQSVIQKYCCSRKKNRSTFLVTYLADEVIYGSPSYVSVIDNIDTDLIKLEFEKIKQENFEFKLYRCGEIKKVYNCTALILRLLDAGNFDYGKMKHLVKKRSANYKNYNCFKYYLCCIIVCMINTVFSYLRHLVSPLYNDFRNILIVFNHVIMIDAFVYSSFREVAYSITAVASTVNIIIAYFFCKPTYFKPLPLNVSYIGYCIGLYAPGIFDFFIEKKYHHDYYHTSLTYKLLFYASAFFLARNIAMLIGVAQRLWKGEIFIYSPRAVEINFEDYSLKTELSDSVLSSSFCGKKLGGYHQLYYYTYLNNIISPAIVNWVIYNIFQYRFEDNKPLLESKSKYFYMSCFVVSLVITIITCCLQRAYSKKTMIKDIADVQKKIKDKIKKVRKNIEIRRCFESLEDDNNENKKLTKKLLLFNLKKVITSNLLYSPFYYFITSGCSCIGGLLIANLKRPGKPYEISLPDAIINTMIGVSGYSAGYLVGLLIIYGLSLAIACCCDQDALKTDRQRWVAKQLNGFYFNREDYLTENCRYSRYNGNEFRFFKSNNDADNHNKPRTTKDNAADPDDGIGVGGANSGSL